MLSGNLESNREIHNLSHPGIIALRILLESSKGCVNGGRFLTRKSGNVHANRKRGGWTFQVDWKGGSSELVPLVGLKHSNPVDLAEYAVYNQLQEDPVFKLWVKDVLCRRDRIISKSIQDIGGKPTSLES